MSREFSDCIRSGWGEMTRHMQSKTKIASNAGKGLLPCLDAIMR
jgi:hypothetical protein